VPLRVISSNNERYFLRPVFFMRGKFITLEGVDGAGKSTHVEWLADQLRSRGHKVFVTREPGGTELAESLRSLMLHQPMSALGETLLAFAAREDHVRRYIAPALEAGTWVVCDRFTDSTYAYQGGGKGIDAQAIQTLSQMTHPTVNPDRTLIFDCPWEVSQARIRSGRRVLDRFEKEGRDFFERVRGAYLQAAQHEPARIRVLDATQPVEAIRAMLIQELAAL